MEELISGYCRTQDAARMVLCEKDGGVWEADCDYAAGCAYRDVCEIGKQIKELEERA